MDRVTKRYLNRIESRKKRLRELNIRPVTTERQGLVLARLVKVA